MSTKQEPITAADLTVLEVLCAQLNAQPYQASYFPFGQPYVCGPEYHDLRADAIFWSSGHGWRLHTGWREALAAKRARLEPQSDRR